MLKTFDNFEQQEKQNQDEIASNHDKPVKKVNFMGLPP